MFWTIAGSGAGGNSPFGSFCGVLIVRSDYCIIYIFDVGIPPHHAGKLRVLLTAFGQRNASGRHARTGMGIAPSEENLAGHHSVMVGGIWRMTCTFNGTDVVLSIVIPIPEVKAPATGSKPITLHPQ